MSFALSALDGLDLTSAQLAGVLRVLVDVLEGVTGAVTGDVTRVSVTARRNPLSAGALRTRRWRQKLAAAASQGVTGDAVVTLAQPAKEMPQGAAIVGLSAVRRARAAGSVTSREASQDVTSVTPVTVVTRGRQKEVPPTPPLRKTIPQIPPRSRRRHKGVSTGTVAGPVIEQVWVSAGDPLYRELGAMRGHGYPVDRAGGWHFPPFLVEEARARLSEKVTVLRPSGLAMAAGRPEAVGAAGARGRGTGPPGRRETG